ncbi:hypothetical protein ACRN9Z_13300 [Shewanella frigidimarina]|uniref:hypothetical protein n=1 Tax=Shewanella frigidimarina TaxID=56812 RepID=UPI003D7AC3E0
MYYTLKKDSLKEWAGLLCFSVLFIFNAFIQHESIAFAFYHINNLLYITIILFLYNYKSSYFYIVCALYFVCFHQYSSDPYSESFFNFLSGYYKLIVYGLFLLKFKGSLKLSTGFIVALILLYSTFIQFFFVGNSSLQYFFTDVMIYLPALAYLFAFKSRTLTKQVVDKTLYLLFKFTLFIPFICFCIYNLDLHTVLYGSYYFFYGHTISFLLFYSTVYFFVNRDKLKLTKYFPLVLFNVIILIQSMQSAYVVILFTFLLYLALLKGSFKSSFTMVVLLFILFVAGINALPGTWFALKVNQILSLVDIGLNNLELIPSLYVRVYSLLNIIMTNNIYEMCFGRGLGATYIDFYGAFNSEILHAASFPLEEVRTGNFHLIHETFVKELFHVGILGFILINLFWLKKLLATDNIEYIFVFIFTAFLWLSSVQITFFLGIIVLLMSQQFNNRNDINGS